MRQASLRRAVCEFAEHYHVERNHQGLGNALIRGHPSVVDNNGIIQRRQRLHTPNWSCPAPATFAVTMAQRIASRPARAPGT